MQICQFAALSTYVEKATEIRATSRTVHNTHRGIRFSVGAILPIATSQLIVKETMMMNKNVDDDLSSENDDDDDDDDDNSFKRSVRGIGGY